LVVQAAREAELAAVQEVKEAASVAAQGDKGGEEALDYLGSPGSRPVGSAEWSDSEGQTGCRPTELS
jgi:hypothetical protein